MPTFNIRHVTRYEYDRPVREGANQIKIYPFPDARQQLLSQQLNISGEPDVQCFRDYWGNTTGWFTHNDLHDTLIIDSQLRIVTHAADTSHLDDSRLSDWAQLRTDAAQSLRLLELSRPETSVVRPAIRALLDQLLPETDAPAAFVARCSAYIFEEFQYQKGITKVETTVDEMLAHRTGVCQDFAHVLLELLRAAGLPARYVSGYICPNSDGVRGAGATHAWTEVWLPRQGWVGIDPTNHVWVTDQHVRLAVGRHFADCTPVKGTFKGPANQRLSVFVSVGYEDGATIEHNQEVRMVAEPQIGGVVTGAAQQ
jgi:transglutaminase-like putative cysteine protease